MIGHFGLVVPVIIDANRVIIDGLLIWTAMPAFGSCDIALIPVTCRTDPEFKAAAVPQFEATAVSQPDDIWRSGDHRLGCGNAHDQYFVSRVLLADVAFNDPPYNVPIAGFVSGKGRNQHPEFVQGASEMTADQFTEFLATALKVLKASCSPRALIYACMDWRQIHELLSAGMGCTLELYNICVWAKTNAGMGSLYRNQHELVCVFKAGAETPANNIELGRHGHNRSNFWTYRGFHALGGERDGPLAVHRTVKPVALIADVLRDVPKRGCKRMWEGGLLTRFDPNWIAFAPPLIITEAEVDQMVDIFRTSLKEVLATI